MKSNVAEIIPPTTNYCPRRRVAYMKAKRIFFNQGIFIMPI